MKFDDDTVEVIPCVWLTNENTAAYWPPFRSTQQFMKFVTNIVEPDKNKLELTSVRVMKTAST